MNFVVDLREGRINSHEDVENWIEEHNIPGVGWPVAADRPPLSVRKIYPQPMTSKVAKFGVALIGALAFAGALLWGADKLKPPTAKQQEWGTRKHLPA